MNNKFVCLECEDDVILIDKDTFKLSRLKELFLRGVNNKLNKATYEDSSSNKIGLRIKAFCINIIIGEQKHEFNEFQLSYLKDCELLQINSKTWQKGKLKIQVCISLRQPILDNVFIEFCPDESHQLESPLDDIRKMMEVGSNY